MTKAFQQSLEKLWNNKKGKGKVVSGLVFCLSFTDNGLKLSKRLESFFDDFFAENSKTIKIPLSSFVEKAFKASDALVFIGATQIAVRLIAPFLTTKKQDPAVIVIDEKGKNVIPILSGHLGGANALAKSLADFLGATPIITTATDLNGVFAVDNFARENDLYISSFSVAKEVSSRLLDGEILPIAFEEDFLGSLPKELYLYKKASENSSPDLGIFVGNKTEPLFKKTLFLKPKGFFLGTGMRKNQDERAFEASALAFLKENEISVSDLVGIYSAKIKKDEMAIHAFARKYSLKKGFFSEEELKSIGGEFSSSKFVKSVTGVDNVCERSACLASNGGRLVVKKTIINHITFALCERERKVPWDIKF